jgi:hypothetical protein
MLSLLIASPGNQTATKLPSHSECSDSCSIHHPSSWGRHKSQTDAKRYFKVTFQ